MKSPSKPAPHAITPDQLRKAREALGWSRRKLSDASETTTYFISVYEGFGRVVRLSLRRHGFDGLAAIRAVLEQAGVEFIDESGSEPGVRLVKSGD